MYVQRAVPVPGDARDDWKIVRAVSEVLGKPLPYTSLEGVRSRLADVAPHLGQLDTVQPPLWLNGEYFKVRLSAPDSCPTKAAYMRTAAS